MPANLIDPAPNDFVVPSPCDGFEGPEKKLEVHFRPITAKKTGLRSISKEQWQDMLDAVKCTIISQTSNEHFDSFVLSESSMFVYPYKVMIKTCGTTTLLLCLPKLLEIAALCGTTVEFLIFSRKNYNFPSKQLYPHSHFDAETRYLNKTFGEGSGFVFGPLNGDHWHVYVVDLRTSRASMRTHQTFEVMMHDLDADVMAQFFKREDRTVKDTTSSSGIAALIPGSVIDDFQFDPCGYSMNGLLKEWYWTIHITPESHCSYVSFETNLAAPSFSRLLRQVTNTFKPGRMTIALFADDGAPCGDPFNAFDTDLEGYSLEHKVIHSFDGGYSVVNCNFTSDNLKLSSDSL